MSGMSGNPEGIFGQGGAPGHQAIGNVLQDALGSVGGVQGLVDRASQAGLGGHVQSWIGDGSNWPISPAEIERIIPPAEIEQFAVAHGIPSGTANQVLADFLPHAVDQATPNGDPQAAAQSAEAGGGFDFAGLAKRLLG